MPCWRGLHDDGLENLLELGASLELVGNDALSSLRGLSTLRHVGYSVSILDNVPTCEAEWLIDNITLTLGGTIGDAADGESIEPGSVEIRGNDDAATCAP